MEHNPLRAKLVNKAEDYKWSSAKSHVLKEENSILTSFYLMEEIKDWRNYLSAEESGDDLKLIRKHGVTGRPLGSREFIEYWSAKLGMDLSPKKIGRRPKN